jgi:hypothetical protein
MLLQLVSVRVAEGDLGKGCTTAGIMDYVRYHTLNIPITFSCVQAPKARLTLAMRGVGRENGSTTLTLSPDDAPHLQNII